MNGSGLRLVMSQPEATLYIQPPMFDTTVATQITANVLWRNGAPAELTAGDGKVVDEFFTSGMGRLVRALRRHDCIAPRHYCALRRNCIHIL